MLRRPGFINSRHMKLSLHQDITWPSYLLKAEASIQP